MVKSFTQKEQFKRGSDVAQWLDLFLERLNFSVTPTSYEEERKLFLGDRKIVSPRGEVYYVEYKSGIQTYYTGNVFLETASVDTENKPGWVYTCQADFILYAALLNGKILVFRPPCLREVIEELRAQFPERKTSHGQNKGYCTHGILVPLEVAEGLAHRVLNVPAMKE